MRAPSETNNIKSACIADVISWAKERKLSRDVVYELLKIAPRLAMSEEDLACIPADLEYFEKIIVPSPYGSVSNASDLEAARKRGNSRIRSCLIKFWGKAPSTSTPSSASYTALIEAIKSKEGMINRGAHFSTGTHLPLYTILRLARVPAGELDQNEINYMFEASTSEGRKSLKKAVKLFNFLQSHKSTWPEITHLLPAEELQVPRRKERASRIFWIEFTNTFRTNAEKLFANTLVNPDELAALVKKMMAEGKSSDEINQFVHERVSKRDRISKNNNTAITGYKSSLTWLARTYLKSNTIQSLNDPLQLFDRTIIQDTIEAHLERCSTSIKFKDPRRSSTLKSKLVNLRTLAKHGLRSESISADLEALFVAYDEFIIKQREMTEDADAICSALQQNPRLAARLVNAPSALAELASDKLVVAQQATDTAKEISALRLFAVAALYAIQLCRPLRTRNLITLRYRAADQLPTNLRWLKEAKSAEIYFPAFEIKNNRPVRISITGKDAKILWDWQKVHRRRFIELTNLEDGPYLFPGSATPRLQRNGSDLPAGTMSPSAFGELWAKGDRVIGLGLTPHSCRHAVATLILAHEPGNYAKAAAVLADSEDTVRKHYGKDSGEAAAQSVRRLLLAEYPNIFKKIGGQF
ncbi:site-specific integrase [Marivivens sp. LCG002]|uniref:site-specific integrase n=1 Tax=Marivivens sp. LCG002 TaxID=3051171 RepID=UPI00255517C0|nr:site-specific integrase [Marivivens sp. LCG002]WIV50285.1 site-specific integrase [Marivivens sp. LCG002]